MTDSSRPDATDRPGATRCPRCGYDLRGVVESWSSACPMRSGCAECGLEVFWPELLSPLRKTPRWCVEYATGGPVQLRRFAATIGLTLWPWAFWRSLRMAHPPNLYRCVEYLVTLLAALAVLWAACRSAMAYLTWVGGGYPVTGVLGEWASSLVWLLAYYLLCPAGFVAVPVSRRRAKVRWVHVGRIAIYSLGGVWLLGAVLILLSEVASVQLWSWAGTLLGALWWCVAAFPFLWWSLACSRYLQMRHAWGVGAALTIIAFLSALLAVVVAAAAAGP